MATLQTLELHGDGTLSWNPVYANYRKWRKQLNAADFVLEAATRKWKFATYNQETMIFESDEDLVEFLLKFG